MSADELLDTCRRAGIDLRAEGDRLHYRAPRGAMTPALRDALRARKAAVLALLARDRYVTLRPGLIVPLPAVNLAIDLERCGFRQTVTRGGDYRVEPTHALTDADRAAIQQWRRHLAAIAAYEAPTCG